MNRLVQYGDTVARQFNFIKGARDRDDFYIDTPADDYKRRDDGRRGWTSRDVRCRQEFEQEAAKPLPSAWGQGCYRRRVLTAVRLFRLGRDAWQASTEAIDYCSTRRELAGEAEIVHQMRKAHHAWLDTIGTGDDREVDAEYEWRAAYEKLRQGLRLLERFEGFETATATAKSEQEPIETTPEAIDTAATVDLTPLEHRLFMVMKDARKQITFDDLFAAWDGEPQLHSSVTRNLKRLRKKLPRQQWDFQISEPKGLVTWFKKKGQNVP
jgi:hypothetical protein